MRLLTTDTISDAPIRHGEMVHATAISGANVVRDMREAITNTIGGEMIRYERLLDKTIDRALAKLADKGRAAGYDGILSIRISHPTITMGALEVVVSGTGYWLATKP